MQLKITLRSAQVFKNAAFFTKMHLYAAAAVVRGSSSSPPQRTTTDMHGGATPFWWFPMDFNIGEEPKLPTSVVVVRIMCRRSVILGADKCVGAVQLPVQALLDYYWMNLAGNQPANIAVTVLSPSGKPRGVLYLSYMFCDGSVGGGGAAPLIPPCLVTLPSAPPLQDFEDRDRYPAPVAAVPSAPYLPEEFMSH